jgi:uncharacterized protein YjbI with pentapeptide repeats
MNRRPAWARDRAPARRIRRDWITIGAVALAGLPGVAALIALIPTLLSLKATDAQLQISQAGQVTDQYNAAIANLGAGSVEVRLGGIYALQRLMQDTPGEQPTVIAVLCAFVRDETASIATPQKPAAYQLPTDVQAALTVVGTRKTAKDGSTTVLDFDDARLINAQLQQQDFGNADFSKALLGDANLSGANLSDANLSGANLDDANLSDANLHDANLTDANLALASITSVSMVSMAGPHQFLGVANGGLVNLTGADFTDADLLAANLSGEDLAGDNLTRATLENANLSGADLAGADLADANLAIADFVGADLAKANLAGADLTNAFFEKTNLAGAIWPQGTPPPKGWLRIVKRKSLAVLARAPA